MRVRYNYIFYGGNGGLESAVQNIIPVSGQTTTFAIIITYTYLISRIKRWPDFRVVFNTYCCCTKRRVR